MKRSRSGKGKGGRLLITVNVMGSAGPIRFLVNEGDLVSAVIVAALRNYSKEGRLPVLGSQIDDFLLYSPESEVLSLQQTIGQNGNRNFLLCKKQQVSSPPSVVGVRRDESKTSPLTVAHRARSWKSWINKSLIFKIASH